MVSEIAVAKKSVSIKTHFMNNNECIIFLFTSIDIFYSGTLYKFMKYSDMVEHFFILRLNSLYNFFN